MAWTRTDRQHILSAVGPQASQGGILGNTVFQYTQTGAGAASLNLEVSNDNVGWEIADSIALSGAGDHTYSVLVNSWRWYRVNILSLTATNVTVEVSGG